MWVNELTGKSKLDSNARLAVSILVAGWLLFVGSHLETPYPAGLIEAYALPITRIILLAFTLITAAWCPTVGILMAMAYVCLGADTIFFLHEEPALS
jgi:hypothetical protein